MLHAGNLRALLMCPLVLQLVVPPGPSPMQVAEADMAAEKGIRVLPVDCTALRGEAFDYHFAAMDEVKELKEQAAEVIAGTRTLVVPRTREELELAAGIAGAGGGGGVGGGAAGSTNTPKAGKAKQEPEPDLEPDFDILA